MKKYKVKIDDLVFDFDEKDIENFDVVEHQNKFHVLENNKSYKAEITSSNKKNIEVVVNGNNYNCTIKNKLDILIDDLGLATTNKIVSKNIVAPMPGLVLEISKKEGDEIKEGETVLILEAMKMENALKANADGIIKKINIEKAETVEKGFVIIEVE